MHHLRAFAGLLITTTFVVATADAAWAADANTRDAAARAITSEEARQYVDALADDTFEGREAGSRGNRAAGIYIIEQIKKLGLPGAGPKGSFYQPFSGGTNILAMADGSDPVLKDEVIVVSAHYDHVGYGTNRNSYGPVGLIHNGADDNASGVAGMLEVMHAVSALPERPKRSILFAFWDGEEKGLLGSQYWVDHPTVPLSHLAIMINADMIGRLRKSRLEVSGVRTSPGLRRLISRQNDGAGLLLDFNWDIRSDSDHHSFFARSIPFLMVHTGKHDDYHRPSDDADKINSDGLKQIAQLLFGVLVELADAPAIADFRAASRGESRGVQQARERALAPLPGRLGVRWNEATAEKTGAIVVDQVTPGSAADKAGVRAGDRFVTFAGRDVNGAMPFRLSVLAASNPVAATFERAGATGPIEVSLELKGAPARLGVTWLTDDAEPGAVIVNRVTPGSAADQAGIRVGDRIYRIDGHEFADGEEFRQRAVALAGPVALEVESAGRVRSLMLPGLDGDSASAAADAPAP